MFKKLTLLVLLLLMLTAGCSSGAPATVPPSVPPAATDLLPTSTALPSTATVAPPTPTATSLPSPTVTFTPTPIPPLDGRGGGVMAFTSLSGNTWHIYLMNADGSGQRRLEVGRQGGYEPNWSPDGAKLVFQLNGLWITDLASGETQRLPVKAPNPYFVKPAWSPTGEWLAFLNEDGYRGDIYLVRPDGRDQKRLTDTADISRDGNLVWSPDGKQLAFSAERAGNVEIYVMDVAGAVKTINGRQISLTDTKAPVRNLVTSWSPDGSRLAFSSDRNGNTEIYVMNPDGSEVTRLTNNPAFDAAPAFSPDGKQIVFLSARDGQADIYLLDATAGEAAEAGVRRLTSMSGEEAGPVWRPGTAGAVFSQFPAQINSQARYVIYLHGRLIEEQGPDNPIDPRFGRYDFQGILQALAVDGNQVIGEVRTGNADPLQVVAHVAEQVRALVKAGVPPRNITVVGFSKGGVIAGLVSSQLSDPPVNFVILAGDCQDLAQDQGFVFHGRVLSIIAANDEYGLTCQPIAERSPKALAFKEICLETGRAHGEFYLPREEWLLPVLEWIRGTGN